MERVILPYLAYQSPFNKIAWIRQVKEKMTVINKTEKIVISENTAIEDAISKIRPAVVGILTKKISGKIEQVIAEGTGFILTADGLVATANSLLPAFKTPKDGAYYIVKDNKLITAGVIERDTGNNLALLKIQESNLPAVSLGDIKSARLGERVIVLADKFVNLSSIRSLSDEKITLNLKQELGVLNGGSLINTRGEILGLILINAQGNLDIVGVEKIKELLK